MKQDELKKSLRTRLVLVNALRATIPALEKFAYPTQRFEKVLKEALPGYTIHLQTSGGRLKIQIWGNGIDYNERLSAESYFNAEKKDWKEKFITELNICDPSDLIEREEQEEKLREELAAMNAQVLMLREKANAMIESLPIPASATIRAGAYFWKTPSHSTRLDFPALFGRLES